jgi:hypothetical protein
VHALAPVTGRRPKTLNDSGHLEAPRRTPKKEAIYRPN